MIPDIAVLQWLTDLTQRGWNWYNQRSEKVEIEHLSLEYAGAETLPTTGGIALIFGVQFTIENKSTIWQRM